MKPRSLANRRGVLSWILTKQSSTRLSATRYDCTCKRAKCGLRQHFGRAWLLQVPVPQPIPNIRRYPPIFASYCIFAHLQLQTRGRWGKKGFGKYLSHLSYMKSCMRTPHDIQHLSDEVTDMASRRFDPKGSRRRSSILGPQVNAKEVHIMSR